MGIGILISNICVIISVFIIIIVASLAFAEAADNLYGKPGVSLLVFILSFIFMEGAILPRLIMWLWK